MGWFSRGGSAAFGATVYNGVLRARLKATFYPPIKGNLGEDEIAHVEDLCFENSVAGQCLAISKHVAPGHRGEMSRHQRGLPSDSGGERGFPI